MRTLLVVAVALAASADLCAWQGAVDYSKDVAPIFKRSCVACHGATAQQAKLRLDSEAAALKGGVSGPLVVAGREDASLLLKRLTGNSAGPVMPMGGKALGEREIGILRSWIARMPVAAEAATAVGHESAAFASAVRPILAARCYPCHAAALHHNGLRLDSLSGILKGSDTGKVIVPGRSGESSLIRRLTAQDRPRMPYGAPALGDDQIRIIRDWIDAGAPGPDSETPLAAGPALKHWAYVKPVRPDEPAVKDAAWCRNAIDRFVLARLEKEGLKPAAEAPKTALIRRLYLDLIGLPPSPKDVDDFLADGSPEAYERVVDRLLGSPRYGERWARQWLDLARYADTNGYEKDQGRVAWAYRDWVIRALNAGLSFRQFTIEQIAGDLLPAPTREQLIATGFHRNTMLNQEGGVDPEEFYWYSQVDRVNTTASVWLGSTLGCAQCHNHKFDPFTRRDYYRMLAFFNKSEYTIGGPGTGRYAVEPEIELPTAEQAAKATELRAEIAALRTRLDTPTPELDQAQAAWEQEMAVALKRWEVLRPKSARSAGGATLRVLGDESVLASGKNPESDSYTIEAEAPARTVTGFLLEVLPDASLPVGGPGRDVDGNFFLSNFEVEAGPAARPEVRRRIDIESAEANEWQEGYAVGRIFSKETNVRGWVIDNQKGGAYARSAVFVTPKPVELGEGFSFTIRLKHQLRHTPRNIGRFRLSATFASDPKFVVKLPARLRGVLEVEPGKRSAEQKAELAKAYRDFAPGLDAVRARLKAANQALSKLGIATAMTLRERPGGEMPATHLHERGSFLSVGEEVRAGVPSSLNALPAGAPVNRLGLARWLVSEENPLTARVTVNRFWETLFGRGIVETSEDFGTQGDPPTHPELLDWLATEFMGRGWNQKEMLKLMVTSSTYRQSSRASSELIARDPYNKLYARGPRFRVEAEMVHDLALASGGLLSLKMYGPSMMPYQPEGIWDVPYSGEKWTLSAGEDRYRRAVYTYMRRSAPYPGLATFDAPSRESCTVRRVRTNTPLQALTTLNDPFFVEAAEALARRAVKEGGAEARERIGYAFRLVLSRPPGEEELARALTFYQRQVAQGKPEQAAMTLVASVLLNLDEAITKE